MFKWFVFTREQEGGKREGRGREEGGKRERQEEGMLTVGQLSLIVFPLQSDQPQTGSLRCGHCGPGGSPVQAERKGQTGGFMAKLISKLKTTEEWHKVGSLARLSASYE